MSMWNVAQQWRTIQQSLFPWLQEELGPLTEPLKQVATVFEVARIEEVVPVWQWGSIGCPPKSRSALARSFLAKSVLKIPTTSALIERLKVDRQLRRMCGWERRQEVPSEATFSRAFSEFARANLPTEVHERLVHAAFEGRVVENVVRDSTAIPAREKPEVKESQKESPKKRGRPKKGEVRRVKESKRVTLQPTQTLAQMLQGLPTGCTVGTKRNSKGYQESWTGYKLHIDSTAGDIIISCIVTSASLHDSQAAIPLSALTATRVHACYELMDAAYDSPEIHSYIEHQGRKPLIVSNPRRDTARKLELREEKKRQALLHISNPKQERLRHRSGAERVNAGLKDSFGALSVQVQGHAKVTCHLMFGVVAYTALQLIRYFA